MYPQQLVPSQGGGPVQPGDTTIAPVSFWEWFCSVYPPMWFVYNWQHYFVSITGAASTAQNTGNLNIQVPLYAFTFRSVGWVTSSGAAPTFPYFIGIAMASTNDWTLGQWASQIVTGNNGPTPVYDPTFPWPREVPATTQLTVTVNNALNNVALTVHAGVVGLEPRKRDQPIGRLR